MTNPSAVGSGTATSGTSVSASPTQALPAGSVIIVYAGASGASKTVSGVSDGANTYTQVNTPDSGHHTLYAFQSVLTTALTTSSTITATFSTASNGDMYLEVVLLPGYLTLDENADGSTSGSQTSLTVTTPALADADDMALAAFLSTSSAGALTLSSGWTQLVSSDSAGGVYITVGYLLQSSGTGAACTGSVSTATGITGTVAAFEPSTVTVSGTVTLSGSGTLTAAGAFAGSATLSGSGTLGIAAPLIFQGAALSGSGTLSGSVIGTIEETVTLSGSGTLTGAGIGDYPGSAALSGSGTLSERVILGYSAVLSGTGTLGIIGTGGTVAASAGASTPQAFPGTSQVSVAPPGSSSWQYLGSLGLVTALTYSFACPGGCDQMTCTVMVPADYRTQLFDPGWQVRVTRGGHVVWTGKLDEPVPTTSGWNLTAVGDGNRGQDFVAIYSGTWPAGQPDDAVNEAIGRGLPWVNPGIGSPAGIWLGQAVDSGAQTIAALLNLCCTRGGLTWYVNSQPGGYPGSDLSLFPLPTTVNRLLVCTQPVARTLGGDINTIFIKYQATADNSSATPPVAATYGVTSVQNAQSVAMHGELETYIDLSNAGVMTSAAAAAVGDAVLEIYQRASFAGPFTVSYGQLLNTGGQPVDPGCDQAGSVIRMILTDYSYGGEVVPGPIEWIVGQYEWDDMAQIATITPYQTLNESLTSLLSMQSTILTPVTAQS